MATELNRTFSLVADLFHAKNLHIFSYKLEDKGAEDYYYMMRMIGKVRQILVSKNIGNVYFLYGHSSCSYCPSSDWNIYLGDRAET